MLVDMRGVHRRTSVATVAIASVLLVTGACAAPGEGPPTGEECQDLLLQDGPDLEDRAGELLEIEVDGYAWADCDSGSYPAVVIGLPGTPRQVVRRMKELGDAEQVRNSACLEHLPARECDQVWRFAPHETGEKYVVELPAGDTSGELTIAVAR